MQSLDFFRCRIDSMIDLRDPLAVLARRLPWGQIEEALAPKFKRKERAGQCVEGHDWWGPTQRVVGAGVSRAGRPKLPIRLLASLLYLKHSFNLSDEEVCSRWSENVLWQFFSGMDYYEHRLPCDPTQIGRFRQALGEEGLEQLLKATIETAVNIQAVEPKDLERVIVDTTVQEKAIAHPVDSRLLEIARHKVVSAAKRVGISLKQTYAKEGKALRRRAGGYAHAKQFRRLKRVIKRQRTILGVVIREVQRKRALLDEGLMAPKAWSELSMWLERAERVRTQQTKDKNKLYALHAPEVECIGKGKARKPYEFGVKNSLVVSHEHGLMLGARTFTGNPYDGHILSASLEQATNLTQDLQQLSFSSSDFCFQMDRIIPRGIVFDHGIEDAQQFAHASNQCNLLGLTSSQQALVEHAHHRVVTRSHQRGHVQGRSQCRTPTTDAPLTFEPTRVMVIGCHPHQRADLSAVELSQLGQLSYQRCHRGWPQSFDLAQQSVQISVMVCQVPSQISLNMAQLCAQGLNHRLDAFVCAAMGHAQVVGLHHPHLNKLSAPPNQCSQLLLLRISQRFHKTRRIRAGGQYLSQMRQARRINSIRLGQAPHGLGKVACLTRIDDRHRQALRLQRRSTSKLIASCGLQHHQSNAQLPQYLPKRIMTGAIIAELARFAIESHTNVQFGFGYVNSDKNQISILHGPSLFYATFSPTTVRALDE